MEGVFYGIDWKHILKQLWRFRLAMAGRFGFLESVYHNAMLIELAKYGLKAESEKPLKVFYDDQVVGVFNADLFVENSVVVELKSVLNLAKGHEMQLVNYLNCLGKEIGLLINFGPSGVEIKRKYRKPVQES